MRIFTQAAIAQDEHWNNYQRINKLLTVTSHQGFESFSEFLNSDEISSRSRNRLSRDLATSLRSKDWRSRDRRGAATSSRSRNRLSRDLATSLRSKDWRSRDQREAATSSRNRNRLSRDFAIGLRSKDRRSRQKKKKKKCYQPPEQRSTKHLERILLLTFNLETEEDNTILAISFNFLARRFFLAFDSCEVCFLQARLLSVKVGIGTAGRISPIVNLDDWEESGVAEAVDDFAFFSNCCIVSTLARLFLMGWPRLQFGVMHCSPSVQSVCLNLHTSPRSHLPHL